LTEAPEHLHAEGLIHRDIKPSNIIFVASRPKLADIGLITAAEFSETFVGTEGFVVPEGPGTEAADLFALGKVLYEVATGCDRNRFPSLPEDLDQRPDRAALMELNEIWLKACDPDPTRRHASAAALRQDLEELATGRSMWRWRLRLDWKDPGPAFELGTVERLTPASVGGVVHEVASQDGGRLAMVKDRGEMHLQSTADSGAGAQSLQDSEKLGIALRARPVGDPKEKSGHELTFEWGFGKALLRTRASVELIRRHG
jgi:serine/threonine protein kinase